MRTLDDIRLDIERTTERRAELLHVLAEGHDDTVAAEHAELEDEIARLWDEYREAKVRGRFGDRDAIIKRARLEERLERAGVTPITLVFASPRCPREALIGSRAGNRSGRTRGLPNRKPHNTSRARCGW